MPASTPNEEGKGQYLPDGGDYNNRYLLFGGGVNVSQTNVTYYTHRDAQNEYVRKLEALNGLDLVDYGLFGAAGISMIKKVAQKHHI